MAFDPDRRGRRSYRPHCLTDRSDQLLRDRRCQFTDRPFGDLVHHCLVELFAELAEGGVCSFKLSTYEYDAVRFPRIDHPTMIAAFEEIGCECFMGSQCVSRRQYALQGEAIAFQYRVGPVKRRFGDSNVERA